MGKNQLIASSIMVSLGFTFLGASAFAQTSSNYAELACQREIVQKMTNGNTGSFLRFNDAVRESFVSNAERRIQGEGQQVNTDSNGRITPSTFNYDCTVNTSDGRVTAVNSTGSNTSTSNNSSTSTTSPTAAEFNKEKAISMCHRELKDEISSDSQINLGGLLSLNTGRELNFNDSAETYVISNAELGVRGDAVIRQAGSQKSISYDCTVNVQDQDVTKVSYR